MKIETTGIKVQDLQSAPRVSEACDALVEVQKVIRKDGVIVLILCILAATLAGQIHRVHPEYLNLPVDGSDTAQSLASRILRFLWAFGLVTEDQINANEGVDFDPEQLIGKQAIVQITNRKFQPLQVDFYGVWAVDDPAAPFVPPIGKKEEGVE